MRKQIYSRKGLNIVWLSNANVAHYRFTSPDSSAMAEAHCQQLQEVMKKVKRTMSHSYCTKMLNSIPQELVANI